MKNQKLAKIVDAETAKGNTDAISIAKECDKHGIICAAVAVELYMRSRPIVVGSYVRSHDFEDRVRPGKRAECYIEGTVTGFMEREGSQRYIIKAEKRVWDGKEIQLDPTEREICPPVNGTIRASTDEAMYQVELLK